jgi:hypothetical protein
MFIIFVILCFMLYYLTSAVQSLIEEIKEIKTKCVHSGNTNVEDFKVATPDPGAIMTQKAWQFFTNIKNVFGHNM